MVVGRYQEASGAGGGVVDGFANLRIHHFDNGADDVSRCAELAQFTSLLNLAEDMFEQVSLSIGIRLVQAERVYIRDDLRQHCRIVDAESGAIHEVDGTPGSD